MSTLTQTLTPEARGIAAGRKRLVGRKILIVGAGQQNYDIEDPPIGNGRAISRLLAREGARVAIADVDEAAVKETAHQVRTEGEPAVVIVADVGEPSEIERMVGDARTGLDGIDGLVVNVGIAGGWGLEHTSAEESVFFSV